MLDISMFFYKLVIPASISSTTIVTTSAISVIPFIVLFSCFLLSFLIISFSSSFKFYFFLGTIKGQAIFYTNSLSLNLYTLFLYMLIPVILFPFTG